MKKVEIKKSGQIGTVAEGAAHEPGYVPVIVPYTKSELRHRNPRNRKRWHLLDVREDNLKTLGSGGIG